MRNGGGSKHAAKGLVAAWVSPGARSTMVSAHHSTAEINDSSWTIDVAETVEPICFRNAHGPIVPYAEDARAKRSNGSNAIRMAIAWYEMTMKRPLRLRIALLAGACTVAANAHHSFAAVYDSRKPTTLSGVVTGVEWLNPHARFFGDAENDAGVVENRGCELGAFTAPWTVRQSMHYLPDTELIEHICEENDKLPERIGIE